MRKLMPVITCLLLLATASAQDKNAVTNSKQTVRKGLISDVFKGTITGDGKNVATTLTLMHEPYADDGNFAIDETLDGKTKSMKGDWTVLRGDATDEDATVVELDGPGSILYFLRRKDGSLQKLDTSLRAIKPVDKYVLRKEH